MRKETLLGVATIPAIFTIGVVAFLIFLPSESRTLGNFISYTSSLATILMVLVVIITTSLQLREMTNARLLQTQPFPTIKPSMKSHLEKLRFFYNVPGLKTVLERRLAFYFEVENIGNGPIVAFDIVPRLIYTGEKGKALSIDPLWKRIDSLRENEKKELFVIFVPTNEPEMADCIIQRFVSKELTCGESPTSSFIELTILYKNVLGASFKQKTHFDIFLYREDREKLKTCLKLLKTTRIDYSEKIRTSDSLHKTDQGKARAFLRDLNSELSTKEGYERIYFQAVARDEMFSIKTISESEYQKEMKDRGYGRTIMVTKDEEFYEATKENQSK